MIPEFDQTTMYRLGAMTVNRRCGRREPKRVPATCPRVHSALLAALQHQLGGTLVLLSPFLQFSLSHSDNGSGSDNHAYDGCCDRKIESVAEESRSVSQPRVHVFVAHY